MAKYKVMIVETYKKYVEVEESSADDAAGFVWSLYEDEQIKMTKDDWSGTSVRVLLNGGEDS